MSTTTLQSTPLQFTERQGLWSLFASLSREQKESIGLLQIGTFLEYFDLMIYVHMAVLLNELFFPKTDSHTASLLAAFAFCSTFIFRPIGALIFGWMGDRLGRKSTIISTTLIMAISCIIMANLPTYAQIGITAAWIMTVCRIAQGMSCMGEIIGAEIYITESVRRPASYSGVAFIYVAANLGVTAALGVAALVTSFLFDWRIAFWIGAFIAIVGAVARTRLRETPDFLALKRKQMKQYVAKLNREEDSGNPEKLFHQSALSWKERANYKTLISFFLIYCGWPVSFYLAFMYFNPTLKEDFGYFPADIIRHNFFLSAILVASEIFWASLSARIHPIKIVKVKWIFILLLMVTMPFLVLSMSSPMHLFFIQALILVFSLGSMPLDAVLVYHLPIYRRFTFASFLYALSRALIYIITSFGLVYLGDYCGHFGLWFITLPAAAAFLYGVLHFESLERRLGIYPNLS